jgi:hypothetical protein
MLQIIELAKLETVVGGVGTCPGNQVERDKAKGLKEKAACFSPDGTRTTKWRNIDKL